MPKGRSSQTAEFALLARAAHQLLESPPLVLDDPVSLSLITPDQLHELRACSEAHLTPAALGIRTHMVVRSRFAEDCLAAALHRGVTQFVVLGAGFDSFAFRQPVWANRLSIIEVDQPDTQTLKRARLASANITVPENVRFADIDFEQESLGDGLRRHGVSFDEPTFFSWLGVTMYLTEPAIDEVLRTLGAFPSESEVVLSFAAAESREGGLADGPAEFATRAASVGEPWITYFARSELEEKLRNFGFTTIQFLTPEAAQYRYFGNRRDALASPRATTIVSARIDSELQ